MSTSSSEFRSRDRLSTWHSSCSFSDDAFASADRVNVVAAVSAPRGHQFRQQRKQRRIPIDHEPALATLEARRQIPKIGASASGEIEHLHCLTVRKRVHDRAGQALRSSGSIGRLAELKPG